MADIILCSNVHCPVRSTCHRSSTKVEESQVWSNFEYFCNENSGFADYIPITTRDDRDIVKVK